MSSTFKLTYRGPATEDGFDMSVIGESMIGFNNLLKDFHKASGIDGELQVKTTSVHQGCVIVEGLLVAELTTRLIENPQLFLEALNYVNNELWQELNAFLSAIANADKTINDFFKDRPVDLAVLGTIAGFLLERYLKRKKNQKVDVRISKLEQKLESLQQQRRFNKALRPLQENGYDSITYATQTTSKKREVIINDSDLESILPEEEKILPELENGARFSEICEIKSLSAARGERVGVSFHNLKFRNRTYTALPDDNHTSASYRNLYGETASGEFEVIRKSMYKVPEFKIVSLEKQQTEMFEDGESE